MPGTGFAVLALVVSLALPAAASAGMPADPGAFIVASIEQKVENNWAAAWATLYPAHQLVAPKAAYVRCEQLTPWPAKLVSLRVVRVHPTLVTIAGIARPVPGEAVTVAYTLRAPAFERDPFPERHTFHLVSVNGSWRWILSHRQYRLFTSGACGSSLPAT